MYQELCRFGFFHQNTGEEKPTLCIQVGEDSLAGAMESHEVDTEAKLGLIKDVAHCKCYIGDLESQWLDVHILDSYCCV